MHRLPHVQLDVERQYGIPICKQKLSADGKQLLDPLSLVDCAGISAGIDNEVQVTEEP